MKIARIEVEKKDLGNAKPYTIAFKTVDEAFNIIVKITFPLIFCQLIWSFQKF